jgi:hypothetical protein
VIEAISKEKNKEIAALREEFKELRDEIIAKDGQINIFMKKEGELKGKDELIATLNRNIEKY